MKNKIAGISTTILIAFAILLVSVLRCSNPKFASSTTSYAYSPIVLSETTTDNRSISIDYALAYQGKILPDNPLWYLKVLRDKAWLAITFNDAKKADLNLLFADKRLNASLELFKNNKPDLGTSTLSKSGKYMEKAGEQAKDNKDLLNKLALSSLKHRQVIEDEILPLTPEDLRAEVIKIENYSKLTYINTKERLLKFGLIPPENPFKSE
jgi:hypothetical protein